MRCALFKSCAAHGLQQVSPRLEIHILFLSCHHKIMTMFWQLVKTLFALFAARRFYVYVKSRKVSDVRQPIFLELMINSLCRLSRATSSVYIPLFSPCLLKEPFCPEAHSIVESATCGTRGMTVSHYGTSISKGDKRWLIFCFHSIQERPFGYSRHSTLASQPRFDIRVFS